jgi:hypothetical protein
LETLRQASELVRLSRQRAGSDGLR